MKYLAMRVNSHLPVSFKYPQRAQCVKSAGLTCFFHVEMNFS